MNINNTIPIIMAFLVGTIPSLIWLSFWLKEENKNKREPREILSATFILGMLGVIITIPIQKFIKENVSNTDIQLFLWSFVEEIIKYIVVIVLVWRSKYLDKPIDWAIYLITSALGFAALENTMFLIAPFSSGENIVALLTGGLRFLGSTLLHSITSAIIGILLGFSFYSNNFIKKINLLTGIIMATALHTIFNFFIIKNESIEFIKIFAFIWVVTIIIMLLFEKLRRISS